MDSGLFRNRLLLAWIIVNKIVHSEELTDQILDKDESCGRMKIGKREISAQVVNRAVHQLLEYIMFVSIFILVKLVKISQFSPSQGRQ